MTNGKLIECFACPKCKYNICIKIEFESDVIEKWWVSSPDVTEGVNTKC